MRMPRRRAAAGPALVYENAALEFGEGCDEVQQKPALGGRSVEGLCHAELSAPSLTKDRARRPANYRVRNSPRQGSAEFRSHGASHVVRSEESPPPVQPPTGI
jgi:hypothetical protein